MCVCMCVCVCVCVGGGGGGVRGEREALHFLRLPLDLLMHALKSTNSSYI